MTVLTKPPPTRAVHWLLPVLLAVVLAACSGSAGGIASDDTSADSAVDPTADASDASSDSVEAPAPKPPWGSFGNPAESASASTRFHLHGQIGAGFALPTASGTTYTLQHLGLQQR